MTMVGALWWLRQLGLPRFAPPLALHILDDDEEGLLEEGGERRDGVDAKPLPPTDGVRPEVRAAKL